MRKKIFTICMIIAVMASSVVPAFASVTSFNTENGLKEAYSAVGTFNKGNPNCKHNFKTKIYSYATCQMKERTRKTCTKCSYEQVYYSSSSYAPHKFGEWTLGMQRTCTQAGYYRRECKVCKKTEISNIAAIGHKYGDWKLYHKATCTAAGEKFRPCKNSGCYSSIRQKIPALGHSFTAYKVTKNPTCTTNGSKKRTCTRCKREETVSLSATGHSYGSWRTTKSASCKAVGVKERTCAKCSYKQTTTIAALPCTYGAWQKTSTYTVSGGVKYYLWIRKCTKCGNSTQTEKRRG